jgi:uncharacterized protein (TIGR03083 family)
MDENPFDLLDREAARIERYYAGLAGPAWTAPTRCAGWNRKDLLAHLCAIEDYVRAGLDNRVAEYAGQAGRVGYQRLNDILVERRAGDSPAVLLDEFRAKVAENHPRLRERGVDATMATSAGPYPVGRQTCYLASELAIHADDAGVPVSAEQRAARTRWRADFALEALAESAGRVQVGLRAGDDLTVRMTGVSATLSAAELVEAAAGRLPADRLPAALRRALVVLA